MRATRGHEAHTSRMMREGAQWLGAGGAANETVLVPQSVRPSSTLRIEVKGYWHGARKCRSNEMSCVQINEKYPPHITSQTVWVRFPPKGRYRSTVTEWSTNRDLLDQPALRDQYVFAPAVLEHEVGHTLQLGHNAIDTRMGKVADNEDIPEKLQNNDRWAAKELVKTHNRFHR